MGTQSSCKHFVLTGAYDRLRVITYAYGRRRQSRLNSNLTDEDVGGRPKHCKMKIVNLTPHDIVVQRTDGSFITIPRDGTVARVETREAGSTTIQTEFGDFTVSVKVCGPIVGLPTSADNTLFVVSKMVADWAPGRNDILTPGELIRDDKGVVVGCKGFSL